MLHRKVGQAIAKKAKEKFTPLMSQTVTVKLTHGLTVHETSVPCFMTFGQLKVWFLAVHLTRAKTKRECD